MMQIPIEDGYGDVLEKAAVGRRLGYAAVALRANLSLKEVRALVAGEFNENHLRKVAPILELDADKLVSLAKQDWRPASVNLLGVKLFHMPFPEASYPDASANCYLVYNSSTKEAIAFDAGTKADPILEYLDVKGLALKAVFLTHTHRDHVGGYERLVAAAQTGRVFAPMHEPYLKASPVEPETEMELCGFKIRALLTNGHSKGGMSYIVSGLERTVAFVGDSLFSLSMGGAKRAYRLALKNNREKLLGLPGDTVLCPGHGPMTTVAEERAHNPFF